MRRYIFVILGFVSLAIGMLGLITPGLPTTPFILLTGYLFAKGSPRLHKKLVNNKFTGPYINRINNGLNLKGLIFSISFMWCMICFTILVVFKNNQNMQMIMLGLGVIGTISQIIVLRKRKQQRKTMSLEIISIEKEQN